MIFEAMISFVFVFNVYELYQKILKIKQKKNILLNKE